MSDQARANWRTAIAAAYIVMGMFPLLGALAILLFAFPAVTLNVPWDLDIIYPLFGLGLAVLVTASLSALLFVAAWGLTGQKRWGKLVAMVAAIVLLPAIPLGTVVGIVALWFLIFKDSGDRAAPAPPGYRVVE